MAEDRLERIGILGFDKYAVVICGPAAPGFVINTKRSGETILNLNGKLYPTSELEKWAPRYAGLDVYFGHGGQEKVGVVKKSWWEETVKQVRGIIEVSNPEWRQRLSAMQYDGRLANIGISQISNVINFGRVKLGISWLPKVMIENVTAVDLVDEPLFGGRFLEAEENHGWNIRALEYLIEVNGWN